MEKAILTFESTEYNLKYPVNICNAGNGFMDIEIDESYNSPTDEQGYYNMMQSVGSFYYLNLN